MYQDLGIGPLVIKLLKDVEMPVGLSARLEYFSLNLL